MTSFPDDMALERHSEKMGAVARLAGGLSHDVGGLVDSAAASVRDALAGTAPDDTRHEVLSDAAAALQRAGLIARQLEVLARHTPGRVAPRPLGRRVRDLVPLATRLAGPGIEVEVAELDPEVWVDAEAGQVEQVVFHLVVNARDAMPEGGSLRIAVARRVLDGPLVHRFGVVPAGDWVTLEVRDSGCGMDESVLSRLFEPFFTTKTPGQGSGLGLATVYGIARQLAGQVMVETAPGSGSAVTLWFPAGLPEVDEGPLPDRDGVAVLVVEDDEWVRAVTARALRHAGYGVLEAADAPEALALLSDVAGAKVQVVLTDIVMPGMGGEVLARRLAAERPGVRLVLMTGRSPEMVAGIGLEGVPVLHKPFSRSQLLAAIAG